MGPLIGIIMQPLKDDGAIGMDMGLLVAILVWS